MKTPENIEVVRLTIMQFSCCSAAKLVLILGISYQNVRILHAGLKFHSYKIMLARELNVNDRASRKTSLKAVLENVEEDTIIFSSDDHIFIFRVALNKILLLVI